MFALVGASGCGKTTLLRMLAGFALPSSGRILIDGAEMSTVPPHERPVNMMFQSYALFPHMTRGEQRRLRAAAPAAGRCRQAQRIQEALDMVQLGALAQAQAAPALRRSATAGGAGARADPPAQGAAARRAAVGARQEAARTDPVRAHGPAVQGGHHLHRRDPRPGRSDGAGHAHRGDGPRPGGAGGHAVGDLRISAAAASWPTSSAPPTCSRAP